MGKQYELSHVASKAKTSAGRRAIEQRLPKIIEHPKSLLALRGHSTSAVGVAVLNDICALKKPLCRKLQRKNDILPFEAGGEVHLENLAKLNDCSLLALVNHTKKRPHNLILGRTFGFRILDMFEFGITNYTPAASFQNVKVAPGSKPMIVFNGGDFDATPNTRSLQSLLLDVFRGPDDVEAINLAGIDHVIVFTLNGESKVSFRHYAVSLLRAEDSTLPKVELKEAGPHFDLEVRRVQLASEELLKEALKRPRDPKFVKRVKNVSRDDLGDKKGRIHVGRQDLSELVLARMKGLKKKRGRADDDSDRDDADDSNGNDGADVNSDADSNGGDANNDDANNDDANDGDANDGDANDGDANDGDANDGDANGDGANDGDAIGDGANDGDAIGDGANDGDTIGDGDDNGDKGKITPSKPDNMERRITRSRAKRQKV